MTRNNRPGRHPFGYNDTPDYSEPNIPLALMGIGNCSRFTRNESGPFIIHTAHLSDDYPLADRGLILKFKAEELNEDLCDKEPGSNLIVQGSHVCLNRVIIRDAMTESEAVTGTLEVFTRYINQLDEELKYPEEDNRDNLAGSYADDGESSFFPGSSRRAPFYHAPHGPVFSESFHRCPPGAVPLEEDADEPYFDIPPVPPHFRGRHAGMDDDIPCGAHEDETKSSEPGRAEPAVPEFEYGENPLFDESIIVACTIPAGVTELLIPDGVAGFGPKALCGLEDVVRISLPASIRQIDEHDFDFLPNLVDIEVRDSEGSLFESIDGVLYRKGRLRELVRYGAGRTADQFSVPDGVVIIGRRAFAGNPFLRHVILPETVWDVHDSAFARCPWLECAQFNSTEAVYIREYAFASCPRLIYVHLICSELNISEHAFEHCTNLFSISLPGDLTLESHAFDGCADLREVTLTGELERAGHNVFTGCADDLEIHCSEDAAALIPEYRDRIIPTREPATEESSQTIP